MEELSKELTKRMAKDLRTAKTYHVGKKSFIKLAKDYISEALAFMLDLGKGNGPMNHAFMLSGKYAAKSSEE